MCAHNRGSKVVIHLTHTSRGPGQVTIKSNGLWWSQPSSGLKSEGSTENNTFSDTRWASCWGHCTSLNCQGPSDVRSWSENGVTHVGRDGAAFWVFPSLRHVWTCWIKETGFKNLFDKKWFSYLTKLPLTMLKGDLKVHKVPNSLFLYFPYPIVPQRSSLSPVSPQDSLSRLLSVSVFSFFSNIFSFSL